MSRSTYRWQLGLLGVVVVAAVLERVGMVGANRKLGR